MMDVVDPFAEPTPAAPEIRNLTRDQAVKYGRQLGEHEANRRRESGTDREQRIKRAMAYAAWDYDGKPLSSESQRREFGVIDSPVTPSLERALFPPKKEKT